jgi:hypothetical protein
VDLDTKLHSVHLHLLAPKFSILDRIAASISKRFRKSEDEKVETFEEIKIFICLYGTWTCEHYRSSCLYKTCYKYHMYNQRPVHVYSQCGNIDWWTWSHDCKQHIATSLLLDSTFWIESILLWHLKIVQYEGLCLLLM